MEKNIVHMILVGPSVLSLGDCADLSRRTPHSEESPTELFIHPQRSHDLAVTWE